MYYTDERQAQIVICLMKAHGIRHVIVSPGATNLTFVGSIQTDPFFSIYSAVDERSAAYMACGMAAELSAPVAISCTGATASRNYLPGLTEAYYRNLPVLAVTSTQMQSRIGHLVAQVIDRSVIPNDVVKASVDLPIVKDEDSVWDCEVKVNRAILEMKRRGGGPAHINLPTVYSPNFSVRKLPVYRAIHRWTLNDDNMPPLQGRIGVFIGSHKHWTATETEALERFCEVNNAAVFCDHTSGYNGKYRLLSALLGSQESTDKSSIQPDIHIHIGEITGDYYTQTMVGKEVWRVSPDGELRDPFRKLRHVFEMPEEYFFRKYSNVAAKNTTYHDFCQEKMERIRSRLPELPFSNIWLASQIAHRIPDGSVIHFAILNSLRAWNFFELPPSVTSASNVGGFGIDGCMSTIIGASLVNPDKIYYLIIGDLAFFYDMNALGSRHLGANLRILLVNNGKGTEFTQHGHAGSSFEHDTDKFVAADGHFGKKSRDLVKGYAEALGLKYRSMSSKNESSEIFVDFLTPQKQDKSILIEAFIDAADESDALRDIRNALVDRKRQARAAVKRMIGPKGAKVTRKLLK